MRKVKNYEIKKESIEDMCAAGRFNPCLEITYRDRNGTQTHKLSAGYEDDLYVYRDHEVTYVLSENHRLGYAGIEAFTIDGLIGSDFHQEYDRMELHPATKIRRLSAQIFG